MRLIMLTFAATLAASAAFAQEGGAPAGGGAGGGGPSPAMRAAFQAARQACADDSKSLCAGKTGREAMMCLRQNSDKLSPGCKDAMSKLPQRRPQQ